MHGVHFFGMETKNDHKFLNLKQFLSRQLEKKGLAMQNFWVLDLQILQSKSLARSLANFPKSLLRVDLK